MAQAFDQAPIDPRFVNGERTIAVSNPATAADTSTYRIARFLNLPHGVYNIKWFSRGISTLRIGKTLGSLVGAFSSTAGSLVNTQVYIEGGDLRFDIELQGSGAGVDTGVMFLIYAPDRIVYASNADGWVFDNAAPLDAALAQADDQRLALPVWSVLPNWKDGITEFVEYKTDTVISETGTTQTRSLREFPRRYFEFAFARYGVTRARMDAMLVGMGSANVMLPLWHDQHRPVGGVVAAQVTLTLDGDAADREYRADDYVILTEGDADDYELLHIASIAGNTLTFSAGPVREWAEGCRIAPMRVASIIDTSGITNLTDRVGTATARFKVEEAESGIGADWGDCSPIWKFPINWASNVDTDYERLTYTFDNETSLPVTLDPGKRATVVSRAGCSFVGRGRVAAIKRFIQAAKGRAKRFWMPSLTQDLIPASGIGGDDILVERSGLSEYTLNTQDARRFIMVVFADGSPPFYREIISVQRLSDADLLTLDVALPPATKEMVERIQFLMPVRFNQDRFEFKHLVDQSRVVTASFTFRSTQADGLPLPNCGLTSRPYPVITSDQLDVGASVVGIEVLSTLDTMLADDELDVLPSVAGIEYPLTVTYLTYSYTEALDIAPSIAGIEFPLTVTYSTYDSGVEALDVAPSIAGIEFPLTVTYIPYDMGVEALDVAPSITEITFT